MYGGRNHSISTAGPPPRLRQRGEPLPVELSSARIETSACQATAGEQTEVAKDAAVAYPKESDDLKETQYNEKTFEVQDEGEKFAESRGLLFKERSNGGGGRAGDTRTVATRKSQHLICEQKGISAFESGRQWKEHSSHKAEEAEDGGEGRSWLTQQQSTEEFCLSVQTLRHAVAEGLLTVEKRLNPYGSTYAPMRLYRRDELRRLAFQTWGDEAGVEEERERRREQRWQSRQQLTGSIISGSPALVRSSGGGCARGGRSLPNLKTFLRTTARTKKGQTLHSTGGVLGVNSSAHRSGRKLIDRRDAASKQQGRRRTTVQPTAVTARVCSRWNEVTGENLKTDLNSTDGHIGKHTHPSSSEGLTWEEI